MYESGSYKKFFARWNYKLAESNLEENSTSALFLSPVFSHCFICKRRSPHRLVEAVSWGVTCGLGSLTTRFICETHELTKVFDGCSWGKAGPSVIATINTSSLSIALVLSLPHSIFPSTEPLPQERRGEDGFPPFFFFFSWHMLMRLYEAQGCSWISPFQTEPILARPVSLNTLETEKHV